MNYRPGIVRCQGLWAAAVRGAIVACVDRPPAILLPGSVLPAAAAYAALLEALGPDVDAVPKELEVYAAGSPPPGFSLDTEVDGILREADSRGWERFHLVGYSAGGAAALACVARHPDRLRSVALLEPAWAGSWDWSAAHRDLWDQYARLDSLPPEQFLPAFMRLNVRPDVQLPPPPSGPPPPWMALRPNGIRAFMAAFGIYQLEPDALRAFSGPVYFALGGLSNPVEYAEAADRLAAVFPDFRLEVFEERHHFDPPHRVEPQRLAASLREVWAAT